MRAKEFFGKLLSRYLWLNLCAMAIVVVLLCVGVKVGLDIYTHHGEGITVPKVENMDFEQAKRLIEQDGLKVAVADSGYNKRKPAGCILAQSPAYGAKVKAGHIVYVTVNSPSSPSKALPDIIDNSSSRDAAAKLQDLGFRLLTPEYVIGEKDWVYGVKYQGRRLSNGDIVPIDASLTLVIGNGQYEEGDVDIDYSMPDENIIDEGYGSDEDPFEEVTEPPVTEPSEKK